MRKVQCLDIGNTSTKLGLFNGETLTDITLFNTSEFINKPSDLIRKIENANVILSYCSVVPNAEKILLEELAKFPFKIHSVNSSSRANLPLTYPNPKEIGADRIANSIAAFNTIPLPAVVIDLGTATTFDIVTSENGYEGGIILPGPQGFLDYLADTTALLPQMYIPEKCTFSLPYGKSTEDAMLIGVCSGYKAMIEGIINKLEQELGEPNQHKPIFVVSGGSSLNFDFIKCEKNENLTLEGLRLALNF
jgi:type III pantothenate kinase